MAMTLLELATLMQGQPVLRRFPVEEKHKTRWVNDPVEPVKRWLKEFNKPLTRQYMSLLESHGLTPVAHAYLPKKSIRTNAAIHQHSDVIVKFDFKGFYDHVQFPYFEDALQSLLPEMRAYTRQQKNLAKRIFLDGRTGCLTQGLPVSGALAGIALIPFWEELGKRLPEGVQFTQYSDDLTVSVQRDYPPNVLPKQKALTLIIQAALRASGRDFPLNHKKSCTQYAHFRKVTGVRLNHENQMACLRGDYRKLRSILHALDKAGDMPQCLASFGYGSEDMFRGKVAYYKSIDQTGKISRLLATYPRVTEALNLLISRELKKQ